MRTFLAFLLCCWSVMAGTYTSTFSGANENPISEGGQWVNGGTDGLDWSDCAITNHMLISQQTVENPPGSPFNDAGALLTGSWGATQTVSGVVYFDRTGTLNDQYCEIELWLRASIASHNFQGYEIDFSGNIMPKRTGYIYVVKWNGPFADNAALGAGYVSAECDLKTGDVISATVTNSDANTAIIRCYINGTNFYTATDTSAYNSGSPGVGFDMSGDLTQRTNYGFTSFTASDGMATAAGSPVQVTGFGSFVGGGTLMGGSAGTGAGGDVTPPNLSTATISGDGTTWTMAFNEAVSVGSGGSGGWNVTMSVAGDIALTYSSGSGTSSLVYTGTPTVNSGEVNTVGLGYTQPGNGIEDSAGNDLPTFSTHLVINNSTQGGGFLLEENYEDATVGWDGNNQNGWLNGSTLPKYTTSPAPLVGTHSLGVPQDSYTYAPFTASADVYGYFLFNAKSAVGSETTMFQIRNGGTALASAWFDGENSNRLRVQVAGGTSERTTAGLTTDTTYRIWFHYHAGSGANATFDIEWQDTGTGRSGSGTHWAQSTGGTATDNGNRIYVQNDRLPSAQVNIYDTVKLSASGYYTP